MKTWKLVSGILSTVLFLVVAFQSCAAGVADAIAGQGGTGGGAGILVGRDRVHFHARLPEERRGHRPDCAVRACGPHRLRGLWDL